MFLENIEEIIIININIALSFEVTQSAVLHVLHVLVFLLSI